jgi:hypothetical protein
MASGVFANIERGGRPKNLTTIFRTQRPNLQESPYEKVLKIFLTHAKGGRSHNRPLNTPLLMADWTRLPGGHKTQCAHTSYTAAQKGYTCNTVTRTTQTGNIRIAIRVIGLICSTTLSRNRPPPISESIRPRLLAAR